MITSEYREASEEFRRQVGAQPLVGVLATAALACAEARAALMRAGIGDLAFDRQLLDMQRKLELESRHE